jgi:hypothetical protein
MNRSWKSLTAGILDIIAGNLAFMACIWMGLLMAASAYGSQENPWWVPVMIFGVCTLFIAAGILAIAGGICCIYRKKWGLALAGSIVALVFLQVIGVIPIVLTALSRSEFTQGPFKLTRGGIALIAISLIVLMAGCLITMFREMIFQ